MAKDLIKILPIKNFPTVTIAMPIYNAGAYLRSAVISVISQNFIDWELIIIDDGSTDNAIDGIFDVIDFRIKIIRDYKNKGLAVRLNEAIDMARGRYFARMDQDDICYPERLIRQVSFLEVFPQVDLLATKAITIDENDEMFGMFASRLLHEQICARPWQGFYMPHPTWLGRIEWFRKHRYLEPAPYLCEDQELLLRTHRNSCFATIDEVLLAYRIKKNINVKKLRLTYISLFKMQTLYFIRLWKFISLLFAFVVFVGRVVSSYFPRKYLFILQRPIDCDPVNLLKWREIRDLIINTN